MIRILHNPRCTKSRAAVALLENRKLDFEIVRYLDNPPTAQELAAILEALGVGAEEIVRKGEKLYRELELAHQQLSQEQWLDILAKNPKLIERPIVICGGKAAIGRPLENIEAIL